MHDRSIREAQRLIQLSSVSGGIQGELIDAVLLAPDHYCLQETSGEAASAMAWNRVDIRYVASLSDAKAFWNRPYLA